MTTHEYGAFFFGKNSLNYIMVIVIQPCNYKSIKLYTLMRGLYVILIILLFFKQCFPGDKKKGVSLSENRRDQGRASQMYERSGLSICPERGFRRPKKYLRT